MAGVHKKEWMTMDKLKIYTQKRWKRRCQEVDLDKARETAWKNIYRNWELPTGERERERESRDMLEWR
jgi:hypothetical protein